MNYTHAISRVPADNCAQGLTTSTLGAPDAQKTRAQFDAYVSTLLRLGITEAVVDAVAFGKHRGGRAHKTCYFLLRQRGLGESIRIHLWEVVRRQIT
jgi:hypothetical protein